MALCPICATKDVHPVLIQENIAGNPIPLSFYGCPVCGKFELKAYENHEALNSNHMASFFVYNKFEENDERYYTVLDEETCDALKTDQNNGRPVHFDPQMIENWYPKSFAERIDRILLYLEAHTQHMGEKIKLNSEQLAGVFFIDRWESTNGKLFPLSSSKTLRDNSAVKSDIRFMAKYLADQGFIGIHYNADEVYRIQIMPQGYIRLDELQKRMSHGQEAFVAMQFGDKTKRLREAIRKGVSEAGYNAIFIDEVEHNNLITPELLKYIRDSKFVVVDLTYENKGAYFEEGYALGIGKAVIQLCQKDTSLHFDIAQKNTIIWENEEDIPKRLANRIRATID